MVCCEEVAINAAEKAYAQARGLLTTSGQGAYLRAGKTITFPSGAVEVKADRVQASSYQGVAIENAPTGVNPHGGPFPGGAAVGTPSPPPAGAWKPLDFSWFLGFGVPTR